MQDNQYLDRMFEDLYSTVSYYPNNPAWSREQSKYLKKRIIAGIQRAFQTLDVSNSSEAEVTSTSSGNATEYQSIECSCARVCTILSPRQNQHHRSPSHVSDILPRDSLDLISNHSLLHNRRNNREQDELSRRVSSMRIQEDVYVEDDYADAQVDGEEQDGRLMTEDESSVEDDNSSEKSEELHKTIQSLRSFRNSVQKSATDFKVKMEELQETVLKNVDTWIIRKKFKGVPVVERRQKMIEVLLSCNYKVCFNEGNIKLPSSYEQLVETAYPKVSKQQKQVLMGYFAGAVTGNSFFKEVMKSVVHLHTNCKNNNCKANH